MGRPLLAACAAFAPGAYLGRGARIGMSARVREPPRALNPGERDRRRDLALRGIAYQGSAASAEVLSPAARPWQLVAELRARFARRCADVCTTPARAGLVAALGAGDRSLLPPDAEEDLSASGLVHLLSSAGLHLAVVALLVRWAAKRLWLRTPWAARARAAAVASLCAAPAIAAEVLLLGAPWPAVRAGIGAGLALSADLCGRRADGLTALFAAAAACALLDPAATHDLALQLSVAGVAGMLVLADPLRDFLPRPLPLVPGPGRFSQVAGRIAEHAVRLACATAAARASDPHPARAAPGLRTALHGVRPRCFTLAVQLAAGHLSRGRPGRRSGRAAARWSRPAGRRRRRPARPGSSRNGRRVAHRPSRAGGARGVAAGRHRAHTSASRSWRRTVRGPRSAARRRALGDRRGGTRPARRPPARTGAGARRSGAPADAGRDADGRRAHRDPPVGLAPCALHERQLAGAAPRARRAGDPPRGRCRGARGSRAGAVGPRCARRRPEGRPPRQPHQLDGGIPPRRPPGARRLLGRGAQPVRLPPSRGGGARAIFWRRRLAH